MNPISSSSCFYFRPKFFHPSIKACSYQFPKSPSFNPQKHSCAVSNNVITQTKPSQLLALMFKTLDKFVCDFLDVSLPPGIDPQIVLSGNFAPVEELTPTPCEVVEGELPSMLDGVYIRNGPNPQFMPQEPYHLFDGDGMLHSIRVFNGGAMFCSRYVKTHKLVIEKKVGYPFIPSPFSSFNGMCASITRCMLIVAQMLLGYIDRRGTGIGTANTSLVLFDGALFALCETDLPYMIKVTSSGDIVTLSRHDFYVDDAPIRMCAHPKIDLDTRDIFAYQYDIFSPFLTFFKIDPSGIKLSSEVPIFSISKPLILHDFGLTKQSIIFQDNQLRVDPMEIIRGRSPVVFDANKMPRIGILPRHAVDEADLAWINIPGFNMMHVINAWDGEDSSKNEIIMVAPNIIAIECMLDSLQLFNCIFEKVTIDVSKRQAIRQPLCTENLELGTINPNYAGKKIRYVYAALLAEIPRSTGIVKLDLAKLNESSNDCIVARHLYMQGCYGNEPCFVPRERGMDDPMAREDDGVLVTYVHDENKNQSWFLVIDALDLTTVAWVKLPGRVPYGFHGLFVKQSQLHQNVG